MRGTRPLLVILLLLPAATAAEPLTAASAHTAGPALLNGDLSLFQVADTSAATATHTDSLWVAATADRVDIEVYEHQALMVGGIGLEIPDPSDARPAWTYSDTNVEIWSDGIESSYLIQLIAAAAAMDANVTGAKFVGVSDVYMDGRGIDGRQAGETASQGTWFSQVRRPGGHVVTAVDEVHVLQVSGDLMLEATQVLFRIDGDAGTASADSRGETDPQTNVRTGRFVRIMLEDAVLRYMGGGAQWAGPGSVHVAADLVLTDAVGPLDGKQLSHDRVTVGGPVELAESSKRLAVEPAGTLATPESWMTGLSLLALAGVLALPIGVGLGIRHVRVPSLDQVEDALEQRRYGRAARLARRIQRRRPDLEGAWISRGIALTKRGDAWRAAEELSDYLEKHTPQDGVIHYVLGTALLEIGREDAARRAFEVAVAQTPALAAPSTEAQAYS